MSVRESIAQNLPVPNPADDQEMWITGLVLSNVVRTSSEWVFVGGILILVVYLVSSFLSKTTTYLVEVYTERLREGGEHSKAFRYALYVAGFFAFVGLAVILSNMIFEGLAVLSITFCCLCVFTTTHDAHVSEAQEEALPSLKDLSAEDVIKMHKTVKAARG